VGDYLPFFRISVPEVLEHSFLAVEPEVVLVSTNDSKSHLTLQVVFKGMDKLSVKFEFNNDTDTAEEVVREMVRILSPAFVDARLRRMYCRIATSL
jgi:hypothetical protein